MVFSIVGEQMTTVREQRVKSIGRGHSYPLTEKYCGVELLMLAEPGLKHIDQENLLRTFKP